METFRYQKKKRKESEEKIINALGGEERRFNELLKMTGLSKPVLNNHLHRMQKEGKVKKIKQEKRRSRYKLIAGTVEHGHVKRILFSVLSTQIFNDVFEATGNRSWADKEFIHRFSEKVGLLELAVLYIGLSLGREDPVEGGRWIEEAFGTLIQKYAWRRCFFRQILKGEYELKHPVLLKEPVTLELQDKLVRLPEAFGPKVTEKFLRELPEVSEEKLEQFKISLEKAYPDDMKKLNHILDLIRIEGR
ncbi:MAG: helix-turn-helix domain-containing protein [Candidatus Ranarchaeia archaeon]|jgi:DNA-binding Lrp family transcriptional regulator